LHKARREANRDLRAAIAKKQFREDLYYRLAMIEIRMPSLAERKDESASPDAASP
jgi:DNA-binding NtrC family response regulator